MQGSIRPNQLQPGVLVRILSVEEAVRYQQEDFSIAFVDEMFPYCDKIIQVTEELYHSVSPFISYEGPFLYIDDISIQPNLGWYFTTDMLKLVNENELDNEAVANLPKYTGKNYTR